MKNTATISINNDNVRINGENINMHEAGLDGLYSIEEIKEYILEEDGIVEVEEIEFVDGNDDTVNALLKLKELAENGDIYHDVYTGEEWLGINGEGKILLGRGDATDWGKYSGEPENTEEWLNEKNWKPLQEHIKIETVSIPEDGQPGLVDKLCFVQKNTEVSSPVNDCVSWMDEFEVLNNNGEYFAVAKRLY
jgi:hypothetical protein